MAKRGENIYRRKDGRYEGRYIMGYKLDGKPIYGYIYGHTYGDVKSRLIMAKAAENMKKPIRTVGKGKLSEWLAYWLDNIARGKVKPSTHEQYEARVNGYIHPFLGEFTLYKITKDHIQCFVDNLTANELASSTVAGIVCLLSNIMKSAVDCKLIESNPCDGVVTPAVATKERYALDRASQVRLEKAARAAGGSVELGVFLSLYTGLRIGEICALKWEDIDEYTGLLMVKGTMSRLKSGVEGVLKGVLTECPPKSKKSRRFVPLPGELKQILRDFREKYGADDDAYILTGSNKKPDPRVLRRRFRKVAEKAGVSTCFHGLRHTYATRCLEQNFDLQALSELLGHASAGITMRVYAHSVLEHKIGLISRLQVLSFAHAPSN